MFNGTVQNMKPVKIVHLIWAISIPQVVIWSLTVCHQQVIQMSVLEIPVTLQTKAGSELQPRRDPESFVTGG